MRSAIVAILVFAMAALAPAQNKGTKLPSKEGAAKAKAAWTPAMRSALGFENVEVWGGGELVGEPKKQGEHALKWANHTKTKDIEFKGPFDLADFNQMSFWLHSNKPTGETFMIILNSRKDPKVFSYFMHKVTVDWEGWKKVQVGFRSFGSARSPVGWQRIESIRLTASGWDQEATDKPVWVLDDMDFSYNAKPHRPKAPHKEYVKVPEKDAFLKHLMKGHPRLILLDKDLPRVKKFVTEDPLGQKWYANVKAIAERYYSRPVQTHRLPDGRRLLSISRDVVSRIYNWGLVYRIEGDRKWVDRAYKEMEAVVNFPDWNPAHWLDTGEMCQAIGIGYDWFYNDLTEEQRKTIREGLWKHGLRLAYSSYMGIRAEGGQGWKTVTNNWNFVCNGGASMGAMAVLDEMPDKCSVILHEGFRDIQIPLQNFEPDGAWWEGLGYWGYSMRYLLAYLRSLETAFGTDFGFIEGLKGTGFSMAGDLPVYLVSPLGGIFNYADSGSGNGQYRHWGLFYLASRFHNPLYLNFQQRVARGDVYDILYYEPFESKLEPQEVALDKYFRKTEVASMRSSWTDYNALFAAIKCGKNGIAHSHQDLGSFIFYGLGEKWAKDMGTEGQTYQSHKHHISRTHFYRIREEGHNTLVFNPDRGYSQGKKADSKIVRFETSPEDVIAVADLSDAYRKHAKSVKRGYRLLDQRRAFVVQDEIKSAKANEIWWFAHGEMGTEYDVAADGRSVTMKRTNKLCRAYLLSPADARLTVMDAQPLPTSPDPDIQQQNANVRKLAVHLENTKDVTITVLYVPFFEFEKEPEVSKDVTPLADWKLDKTPTAKLSEISVDGKALPDFTAHVFTYAANQKAGDESIPKIEAKAEAGAKAKVTAPGEFPGTATIEVRGKGRPSLYTVRVLPPAPVRVATKPQVKPEPVKVGDMLVSASRHDGNAPKNVLDGNLATRWSADGAHEWIAFEFAKPRELSQIKIAWFNGNARQSVFKVSVSDNGKKWREVFDGESGGKSASLETYKFDKPVKAKVVRIDGYGNTSNLWNSVTEVEF